MIDADWSIRPLRTIEEYRACVDLQEDTWGRGFSERVPTAILKVSQILGGVSAGAFDPEGRLVGFVFGMTGIRDGETVHWSDMLAVRPEAKGSGLGPRLKAYQREQVLELGIEKMYWTFDPLRALNAHLNFNKLGIVAREYERDMYGHTDSPLHRGIGTDRFVALWRLRSERVKARIEGGAAGFVVTDVPVALGSEEAEHGPRPTAPDLSVVEGQVLVTIPSDIGSIMEADLALARAWREATRATLGHYLDAGYEAREFLRGHRTSQYVLALREREDGAEHDEHDKRDD